MFKHSLVLVATLSVGALLLFVVGCQRQQPNIPTAPPDERQHLLASVQGTTEGDTPTTAGEKPNPQLITTRCPNWADHKIDNPEAHFPEVAATLSDPKSDESDVGWAFWIVGEARTSDRRQFIPLAVARLSDPNHTVRHRAIWCLRKIGGEREAAHLVLLLADDELTVHYAAAEALAVIGGQRELVAMDAWLIAGAGRHRDPKSLQHVKECRDALEMRLANTPKLIKG